MKNALMFLVLLVAPFAAAQPAQDVYELLSKMHEATKAADHETYFGMFTDDAVFFGTDIWERWPKDEFESLYKPYMESGNGWWFQMRDRHVDVQPGGTVALFDETLYSDAYGQCRGSGACRLEDGEWKIVRYHLDITMPNGISGSLVEQIRDHEAGRIELMTFNIRHGDADDGDNSWPNRRKLVAQVIRAELPDVLGLQEALRFQIDELAKRLPGYAWVGDGRDDGQSGGEHCPIFYNADKFTLTDSGTFWFSNTPEVPGSTSYGNEIPRICTWVLLKPANAGTPSFIVANVHLDHQSAQSRLSSAKQLSETVSRISTELDASAFILGDFNCAADTAPIQHLIASKWSPLLDDPEFHSGTYHGFNNIDGEAIDNILTSHPWFAAEVEIITKQSNSGVWPSDHFPVRAIVNIKPMNE